MSKINCQCLSLTYLLFAVEPFFSIFSKGLRSAAIFHDWHTFSRSVKSTAPQRGEPVSTDLEHLLTEDPCVVMIKQKKTKGTRKTKDSQVLVIRDEVPELPIGSQLSSALITHKYRRSFVDFSISKSVEPN